MNRIIYDPSEIEKHLFRIRSENEFDQLALSVFFYQIHNNPVYGRYCQLLRINPHKVKTVRDIPFLPIEFFKHHRIMTEGDQWEKVFFSSGTTGMHRSRHYIKRLDLYRKSFLETFKRFYGPVDDYCILALLPGYLEQEGSSLVFMVNEFIEQSGHPDSGFYLDDYDLLANKLRRLDRQNQRIILFGVSHALVELAEKFTFQLKNTIIMETGGMKGRREEITREELHQILMRSFGVDRIHSEYGMAELLSQAYAKKYGYFYTPPWMKALIRDFYDPFSYLETGRSGGINVIDLANLYSCSFIETEDVGRLNEDGSFEVLGRFDYTDIRGCNLMVME
ncbi:MAG: acyltransferase [Bacteroidales bacterium]|nr:acyltransferase [Bacteroidales bacterium]